VVCVRKSSRPPSCSGEKRGRPAHPSHTQDGQTQTHTHTHTPDGEILRGGVGLVDVVDDAALPRVGLGEIALAVDEDPTVEAGEGGGHEGERHHHVEGLCVGGLGIVDSGVSQ
jgi:hypothetical protein